MKTKNNHNKNPNIFAFDMFGLKFCFIPIYLVKAVQDNISYLIMIA